ncbi:hypothetical protein A3740_11700 [Oleiphilus sp. HI0068]|nr:hypothetical protein A3740_11700 [Oleiphilus sp. HI0068]KZY85779.1 hypothetical protein A3741_14960 [Oleiphilus sp. HI0069]KZZ47090.1 hypothetical protein A3755_16775 [Oleiphilus sp. HI0085]
MPTFSLVVIGRNDCLKLSSIYTPSLLAQIERVCDELIYVDSCSSDDSVNFMKELGFSVYSLTQDSFLCASAGRYVGTQESSKDYVIFLDSDMEICNIEALPRLIEEIRGENYVGIVGDVLDIYPDGKRRIRERKITPSGDAISFGGFVILDRNSLISSGSWNPSIPANEELELHSRLVSAGCRVKKISDVSVNHFTIVGSKYAELLALYFPLRKARYGAFGYALRGAISGHSFVSIVKLSPEPFYVLIALIMSALSIHQSLYMMVPIIIVIYLFLIRMRRSLKYALVAPGILFSMPYGVVNYRENKVKYDSV